MEPIIEGKFNQLPRGRGKGVHLAFPACTISHNNSVYVCMLNKKAMDQLDMRGPAAWFFTSDYIVCLPSKSLNAYKPLCRNGVRGYLAYTFPKQLIDNKTVKEGHYKLYRYKSGFAFKHYERLEDMNCEWN